MDSKPVGQSEHASLNQCQPTAANRQKIGALGTHSWWWISFLCNVIDAGVQHVTIGHIVIGLSLHIHSFLNPRLYLYFHNSGGEFGDCVVSLVWVML